MMNYEIFKEVVKEKFMDYMPDNFKGMELVVMPVEKVNMTYDGISIRGKDTNISPTIYINDMYEKYQNCGDLEETLMAACDLMAMEFAKTPQVVDVDSLYKDANEKVVFQLINTEQNRSFLEQVPHREFQDLSIIYKLVINADAESIQSIKVTNSLAERLGMNEEQLFKYAAENTRRILPPRIRNMNDVMKEMFLSDGMPEEIAEMMIREVPPEQTLWIISNNRGIDGAVSMLYENELHELAENLESDLYILPSSVHEVLAVSTELTDPEELAQMVAEVNMQKVALEERLSNQVYHYDKDLRKLTLATDTPNKSLDGIVAEPQLVYDAKDSCNCLPVKVDDVYAAVLAVIKEQIQVFVDREMILKEHHNDSRVIRQEQVYTEAVNKCVKEMDRLMELKSGLYADYTEELLDEKEYLQLNREYSQRIEKLKIQADEYRQAASQYESAEKTVAQLKAEMLRFKGKRKLTQEMVDLFVAQVKRSMTEYQTVQFLVISHTERESTQKKNMCS